MEIISREDAKASGLTRYFTGIACRHGHVALRQVVNQGCVVCSIAAKRAYYHRNPTASNAANKAWRENNKELASALWADWYRRNAEKKKEAARLHRLADLEGYRARSKARRASDPEKYRMEKRASEAKRRAVKVGSDGHYTKADVQTLLQGQGRRCANCRADIARKFHVDHIMPLALGGSNDRKNIQILCQPCNQTKHAKHPIVFAQENGRLL